MTLAPELADVWEMRPKLRQDVVFLDAPTGAYLRGTDTAFLLKGRSAFRWLTALSPYLTGEHTVGQLCSSLDEGQQRTVATLIRALTSRGFAKNVEATAPIPEPLRQHFGRQIDFIDHFADDAAGRFQRFRDARVVLAGSGETLLATALGLLRNGSAHLVVHPDDDPQRYRDPLHAETERLGDTAGPVTVEVRTSPLELVDADVVVYAAESGQLRQVHDLASQCHAAQTLFVPVVWGDGPVVLGPTTGGGQSPCWLCAQLRLTANADPNAAVQTWRLLALGQVDGPTAPVNQVTARMVGNAAAFEVFRALTGALAPDAAVSVVLLDTDTLESTRERVLPHPACPTCQHIPAPSAPDAAADLSDEDLYRSCEILVSPNAGVFAQFTDDPLEQAPLKTARLKMAGPDGMREVTAFDVHNVMGARLAAYRVAVRDYLGRLGKVADTVTASAAQLSASGKVPVGWNELDTATGAVPDDPDRQLPWVPARVLGNEDETVWVPAAVALPFSTANRNGYAERSVAGSAVGASDDEVIARGLASALAYRALTEVLRGRSSLVPVNEANLMADEDIALVVKAAQRFGCPPQLFTLAGAAPAHAVLAVAEPTPGTRPAWAIGTGTSAHDARLRALLDLVGTVQVQHFESAAADLGEPLLSDFDPRSALLQNTSAAGAETTGGGAGGGEAATAQILASLAARGLTALFIDHTTPDIAATQTLRAGVVLLWQRVTGT